MPGWWLRILKTRGIYIRGDERVNRRLVPDHITPGRDNCLDNVRILCYACNDIRGAAILSDQEVLEKVRWWLRENFALKFLWWLNTEPGKGGTLFRNRFMERKAIKLLGPDGLQELANLKITISDSAPDIAGLGSERKA